VTEETTAFANAVIFDGGSAELREGCVRVAAGTIAGVGGGPEAGDRVVDCLLRAATSVNAELLGRDDLGRIVPGAAADLLVLDGDPLQDPSVLWGGPDRRAVFQGGIRVAEQDARLVL
jgi:cytosine/adenosine deaminase-related metal-dependent hydrolase